MPTEERPSAFELLQSLRQQLDDLPQARQVNRLDAFRRRCRMILTQVFGEDSRHLKDFNAIYFSSPIRFGQSIFDDQRPSQEEADQHCYEKGRQSTRNLLDVIEEEVRLFGQRRPEETAEAIQRALQVFRRFHVAARSIKRRHAKRLTLEVKDEYDVQDLLRTLLVVDFEDVREEEPTPSMAGKGSRIDFLVKAEKIAIETKMTREGLQDKEVGTELIDDIARYKTHPSCQALLCLVYDPEERIANPAALERDLSGVKDGLQVHVLVVPKGT